MARARPDGRDLLADGLGIGIRERFPQHGYLPREFVLRFAQRRKPGIDKSVRGRADLCAIARPHLADPSFVMHEAAKIGFAGQVWPKQYQSARAQYESNLARAAADAAAVR